MVGQKSSLVCRPAGLGFQFGLLVAVVALAAQGALGARLQLGASKCTYGPSYWCQALDTSSNCGATSHCIRNVWEVYPAPVDSDDICTICKDMVKEARDQLLSNETQTELKEVLEGSCDLIPIGIIAKECKKLADDFVPELVEILSSEMDPTTVCTVARLCNNEKIDELMRLSEETSKQKLKERQTAIQSVLDDPVQVCTLCAKATNKMGVQMSSKSDEQLLTTFLAFCGEMGSTYSDACKMTVIHNSELLVSSLKGMDEQGCYDLGLCSTGITPDPKSLVASTRALGNPSDGIECDFCKSIVQGWLEQFQNNATLEELKQVMDGICSKLGQPDRIDRCKHIVDDYYIPFLKEVADNLNSTTICAMVSLCPYPQSELDQLDITVLVPYDLDSAPEPTTTKAPSTPKNKLLGGFFMPQSLSFLDTPSCVICKFVTLRLKAWLADGHTKDEIDDGLHQICSTAPDSLKDQCTDFMDKYSRVVEQMVVNGIEVADVCDRMNLCPHDAHNSSSAGNLMEEFEVIRVGNNADADADISPIMAIRNKNDNCATCQYILDIVLSVLKDKDNQDEIKNLLEATCRALPGKAGDRCEAIIDEYSVLIIDFVAKGFTADEICKALTLCKSPKPQGQYCVICEFVIKTVDHILSNQTNVDEVKKALDEVCSILPKTVFKQCTNFIDTYTDAIVSMLVNDLSPDLVCTGLGLCSKNQNINNDENIVMLKVGKIRDNDSGEDSSENDDDSGENSNDNKGQDSSEDSSEDNGHRTTTTTTTTTSKPEEGASEDDYYCMLCEYFVTEAESAIGNSTDATQIEDVLGSLCKQMSGTVRRDCLDFVHSNVDELVNMFIAGEEPAKICAKMQMCQNKNNPTIRFGTATAHVMSNDIENMINGIPAAPSQASSYQPAAPIKSRGNTKKVQKVKGNQSCALCEYAMDMVENQLLGNETLKAVEVAVRNVCYILPSTISSDCAKFVSKYGDEIISKIAELKIPPKDVCTNIGLCSATDLWDASSVGGTTCIWGPALWCASTFHAAACGTVEYCTTLGLLSLN